MSMELNKESVEQAGGDERAKFEYWASDEGIYPKAVERSGNCYKLAQTQSYWMAWQARAALAPPSPAQAEAERPEVVARVVHSNPVVLGQCGPLNANDELMTVAQHAASVARWAEMFNRVEQQRDAALARVAELERQEPVALANRGLHAFWVKWTEAAAGLYGPGIKLYAAPVAQAQHSVPELLEWAVDRWHAEVSLRPLINVHRRALDDTWRQVIRHLGGDTGLLCGPSHDELLAAAPGNSAQHSVPEQFSFEYRHPNGESHTVTVSRDQVINEMPDFLFEALCSKLCNCEPAGETNVVECCCDEYAEEFKLLAAAPVCRLSRSALTEAQMRRLYENSTETENERLGFEAFARLIRRAEAVHQIAAAPGKEGV
ncbi:hypothetical protein ACVT5C_005932 [Pseudomonas aeruginosa]